MNWEGCLKRWRGPGSSVGIGTKYGLDGPGSNPMNTFGVC